MQIDAALISYLEDLSCLAFSDEERSRLIIDLQKTINSLNLLGELDTNGVHECASPWDSSMDESMDASYDTANIFRADEILPSLDRKLLLKNAPVKNEEFFIAPKTVEN